MDGTEEGGRDGWRQRRTEKMDRDRGGWEEGGQVAKLAVQNNLQRTNQEGVLEQSFQPVDDGLYPISKRKGKGQDV